MSVFSLFFNKSKALLADILSLALGDIHSDSTELSCNKTTII